MANTKQKLELTWIGKEEELKLEPRILIEDPGKSYGDPNSENMLIHGDNLLALKALEQDFTGVIKCVYIDPPYNTGSAFEHYDDNLEHSIWLSLMKPRIEILWKLLHKEGALFISIDDKEAHYLKVLCDEVCGRKSFVTSIVWENFYGRSNAAAVSPAHNYILIYSHMGLDWKNVRNLLERDDKSTSKYTNPDNDHRGPWRLGPIFAAEERHEGLMYTITTPSGRRVSPPKGSHWRMTEDVFWKMVADGRIVFGQKGENNPAVKLFLSEVQDGLVPRTWWPHTEVGHSQEAKREIQSLFPEIIPFDTPKPERLICRIIEMSSKVGDWVLDSFLGSGTTSAVAHKMRRKHIGVEFGEHANSFCLPRLKKVVDGNDGLTLTDTVGWKGGGGFKFYNLAPSLLRKDSFGNFVIDEMYNANMLAAAMCKHEGFKYSPDETIYWKHGKSTETDFIFVTTAFLTIEQIESIHSQMKEEESLLICAKSYASGCENKFLNITVKKIPQLILGTCEFGKDNYDMNIIKITEDTVEEQNEE